MGSELWAVVPLSGGRRQFPARRVVFSRVAEPIRAMSGRSSPTMILSGAGGGTVNPAFFCSSAEDATRFQTVGYPG